MAHSSVNKNALQIGNFFFFFFVELKYFISLYTYLFPARSGRKETTLSVSSSSHISWFHHKIAVWKWPPNQLQIKMHSCSVNLNMEPGCSCPLYSASRNQYIFPPFFLTCLWHHNLMDLQRFALLVAMGTDLTTSLCSLGMLPHWLTLGVIQEDASQRNCSSFLLMGQHIDMKTKYWTRLWFLKESWQGGRK